MFDYFGCLIVRYVVRKRLVVFHKSEERDGLNPCCKSYKMLLFSRCGIILLEMMRSRSLQHIHVKDIGR